MNLIGLILIAALSGGIVAVSLRLRPSTNSDGLWFEVERPPEGEAHRKAGKSRRSRRQRMRSLIAYRRDAALYRQVEDTSREMIAG